MKMKFYRCDVCGQIVAMVKETKIPVMCCGKPMKEIEANTSDGSTEKHVPVVEVDNNKVYVSVGDVAHPMGHEHHIEWVSLQTKFGNQRKALKINDEPKVCFSICDGDEVEAVYAYCNLHGLWKA